MTQIQTRNPATGEPLETYETMGESEVFAKIEAAHAAFLDWRTKSHDERAPYLRKIAEVLRANADRFAELMTREMGKLIKDGKTEVEICARIFEYTAEHGPKELADQERQHSGGRTGEHGRGKREQRARNTTRFWRHAGRFRHHRL